MPALAALPHPENLGDPPEPEVSKAQLLVTKVWRDYPRTIRKLSLTLTFTAPTSRVWNLFTIRVNALDLSRGTLHHKSVFFVAFSDPVFFSMAWAAHAARHSRPLSRAATPPCWSVAADQLYPQILNARQLKELVKEQM